MNKNLQAIIDIDKWQKLQDALALATHTAIITVDYKGIPVTQHSRCQNFCSLVRGDKRLSPLCQKCDSRGGLEAIRLGHPYMYLCHFGIVDAAIPILVDDRYLGAIMVGQVMIPALDGRLEYIAMPSDRRLLTQHSDQYEEFYRALPTTSLEQFQKTTDLLFQLSHYIVAEAVEKNLLLRSYPADVNLAHSHPGAGTSAADKTAAALADANLYDSYRQSAEVDISGYPLKSLENVNRRISNAITNARVADAAGRPGYFSDDILQPAFDYMYRNKGELLKMEAMAQLCHVSPSYFSKRFKKVTGETFSVYASRLKILWAKKMLETTNNPVSQIAYDLGYDDVSYFTRVFRKFEKTTPSQYRKYFNQ